MNRLWSDVVRFGFSDMPSHNQADDDNAAMLPVEPTNITGTSLEHLNEDCLLEIFSSDSLTIMDLCSLAETCPRFKQIAQRVFPRDYAIEPNRSRYLLTSKNGRSAHELKEVERILENFGAHFSTLNLDKTLAVVTEKYYGQITHLRLNFRTFYTFKYETPSCISNFQRLVELEVCADDDGEYDFGDPSKLSKCCVKILNHTFCNLERFSFDYADLHLEGGVDTNIVKHLWKFIRRHGHLKMIKLEGIGYHDKLVHAINGSCKELEELTLCIRFDEPGELSNLETMTELKTLTLDFFNRSYHPYNALLQASKSLETVTLRYAYALAGKILVQLFDALSQQKNLRELHLHVFPLNGVPWQMLNRLKIVRLFGYYGFGDENVLTIVRQLTNLEELELACSQYGYGYSDFLLSNEIFNDIVKIVERREHVLTLKCKPKLNFAVNCSENKKVRLVRLFDTEYYTDDSDSD